MPFLAHLDEVRKRLLRVALGVVASFLLCWWQADRLLGWCIRPYSEIVPEPLAVLAVTEQFFVTVRVAFLASLFLAAPFTAWQLWAFVRPGLYPREKRMAVPFTLAVSGFFVAGGWFAYSVGLPAMLRFLLAPSAAGFARTISVSSYVSTFTGVVLGMGLVFETPVLAGLLARLGLLSPGFLLRKFRIAVVGIAFAAALITPSGDIPTMLVFAFPMLALYGVSIVVAWIFQRREPAPISSAEAP
jgi:sec-independent protein translocase protein TatC